MLNNRKNNIRILNNILLLKIYGKTLTTKTLKKYSPTMRPTY